MKERLLGGAALFRDDGRGLFLGRLFGMECGFCGDDAGPARIRGPFTLRTEEGRFEAEDLPFRVVEEKPDRLEAEAVSGALSVRTAWGFDGGVLARADEIRNVGRVPVVVLSAAARFCFSPAAYEVYAQTSRWCRENQGAWRPLEAGGLLLGSEGGRSCQGATPMLCIREPDGDRGLALHLASRGNWRIEASLRTAGLDGRFAAVVEAGQADADLRLVLAPGEAVRLPEILLVPLAGGQPEDGAPVLHSWLLAHLFLPSNTRRERSAPDAAPGAVPARSAPDAAPGAAWAETAPVAYNTWFHSFDDLDPERLRPELEAARAAGCEVFTVDAGWYGGACGQEGWSTRTGDWRERTDGAFRGRMADFAREVRAAGLGFGLWVEPERLSPSVPAVRDHPEWFSPGEGGFLWPRLEHGPAYDWVRSEMERLAGTYELAWLKVDFNLDMRRDPAGAEFLRHYEAWSRLLDGFRRSFPRVFLEGCASGGLRSDLWGLSHCDAHFLSDTVNPTQAIRILQGAALRIPPGRLALWAVLRAAGGRIPVYGERAGGRVPALAPQGAVWDAPEAVDPTFACAAALPGVPGLGGDLAGLPAEHREAVRRCISFYKAWRPFLRRASCRPLTPPRPKEDRTGWAALELRGTEPGGTRLLFAYRLDDGNPRRRFPLHGLDPGRRYLVADALGTGVRRSAPGAELCADGVEVALPARFRAAVLSLVPEEP